jgi:hypothetical protein
LGGFKSPELLESPAGYLYEGLGVIK